MATRFDATFEDDLESYTGTANTQESFEAGDGFPLVGSGRFDTSSLFAGILTTPTSGGTYTIVAGDKVYFAYRILNAGGNSGSDRALYVDLEISGGGQQFTIKTYDDVNGDDDVGWNTEAIDLTAFVGDPLGEVRFTQDNAPSVDFHVLIDTVQVSIESPDFIIVGSAKFYQGAGALTEKFTLPFSGVEPGAMTLDAPLGTVVIGANTPAGQMVNFGASPYNAFSNFTDGIPTGTSATSVKWI